MTDCEASTLSWVLRTHQQQDRQGDCPQWEDRSWTGKAQMLRAVMRGETRILLWTFTRSGDTGMGFKWALWMFSGHQAEGKRVAGRNRGFLGSVVSDSSWPLWTVTSQAFLSMTCFRQEYQKCKQMGCHSLLHRIFLTQRSNLSLLHLLHWQADSFTSESPRK